MIKKCIHNVHKNSKNVNKNKKNVNIFKQSKVKKSKVKKSKVNRYALLTKRACVFIAYTFSDEK